ncbi:flagellar basal body-associated protein FliL [Clostridium liquoris]|jgi:flagellar basal body-associated protein FliL|uniref:Flagellar protein FliL n=1 Tax=Clostridium liquoris TaxID=1289519 RepID=A0A2T0B1D9_9CLOT|nr:flagellar basal body-associated FliL family protein [Clostridium liquoris]PRR77524.1 flagellar basal body-associated protein FliL [Clostridium liquoris]
MSEKNIENKKNNKLKAIIIILLALIVVGGGAFGGYMLFSGKKPKTPANQMSPANTQQANNQQANNVSVNNGGNGNVSTYTYDMGEFLLNLSDENEKRFLKATISLGYENKKLTKELDSKKPAIKDTINSVIRSKKAKDFSTKGTEDIKAEILNKINPMFKNGRCDSIYFQEILVQ